MNQWGIHKMISRIKAEEQIWNKVVDSIFGFDSLVNADKQLRHLGGFVKDVFGVKAVVGDAEAVRALHDALLKLQWPAAVLEKHGVPLLDRTSRLEFIEIKDYMADARPQGNRLGGDQVGVPLVGQPRSKCRCSRCGTTTRSAST